MKIVSICASQIISNQYISVGSKQKLLKYGHCLCFEFCVNAFAFVQIGNARPVVTSHISPPETYYITGLDSALLPSVVQVLLELMFYSR